MGRTGTFIVIDNILEQIEKEQVVDILGAITKVRQRRMKMVQTHVSRSLSYRLLYMVAIVTIVMLLWIHMYRINSHSSMIPSWNQSPVETHKSQPPIFE